MQSISDLKQLCLEAEFYETDEWAADAIFDVELLTPFVIDAGSGRGMLARAAEKRGYTVCQIDKTDWSLHGLECYQSKQGKDVRDFLAPCVRYSCIGQTVITNPPFSLADKFVVHALEHCKARKVLCFQRLAWRESDDRREFWQKYPPNRVYVCGNRATCWRGDLLDPAAREGMSDSSTAHAWFVWERGQPLNGLGVIYKPEKLKVKGLLG